MLARISLALGLVASVAAHGNVVSYLIDGVTYPAWAPFGPSSQPGTINRPYPNNGPPMPFDTGKAIICNGNNTIAATRSAPAKAGGIISTKWDWSSVHPGPVMIYLAKCNGPCATFFDDGPWVKISQMGFDKTLKQPWAEERLHDSLVWSFQLPSTLADGEYLLRTEILGLHAAGSLNGAQFYPSCAHITVSGGTNGPWPQGIKISGAYKQNDKGILVQLFTMTQPNAPAYTAPGGPVLLGAGIGWASLGTPAGGLPSPVPVGGVTVPAPAATTPAPAATSPAPAAGSPLPTPAATTPPTPATTVAPAGPFQSQFGQCGGTGFTGPTVCADPFTCKPIADPFFFQCL